MIRPCDTCGGSGEVAHWHTMAVPGHAGACMGDCENHGCPVPYPQDVLEYEDCPDCVDMPRLSFLALGDCEDHRGAAVRGWFKPDPDTVMRWCFVHDSPRADHDDTCHAWQRDVLMYRAVAAYGRDRQKLKSGCRFVWVPAISEADRLEEA